MNRIRKIKRIIGFALCIVLVSALIVNANDKNTSTTQASESVVTDSAIETTEPDDQNDANDKTDDHAKNGAKKSSNSSSDQENINSTSGVQQSRQAQNKAKAKALFTGVLEITGVNNGDLNILVDKILKENYGFEDPETKYADVNILVLSGKISNDDLTFIKKNMGTSLKEADLSGLTNTSLPQYALKECKGLEKVTLGNIKSIPYGAFTSCTNLKVIETANNFESIDGHAFNGCKSLEIIPIDDVVTFGAGAFQGCTKLGEEVNLESTVSIGNNAFYECSSLKGNLNLKSLSTLGTNSFFKCNNITGIKSLGKVDTVPNGAFRNCEGLKYVSTDTKLRIIESSAFYSCKSLESIPINDVIRFDAGAFLNCQMLSETVSLEKATTIGTNAFNGCKNLKGDLNLKSLTNTGTHIFESCASIASVKSFGTLDSIPSNAFNRCTSLKTFETEKTLVSIGSSSFGNCTSLESITINDVITFGANAFVNCGKLNETISLDKTETIGTNTFNGCRTLKGGLNLKSLKSTGTHIFESCVSLTSVESLGGLEKIASSSFSRCKSLKSVKTETTLKAVDGNAFNGATSLESIAINDVVTFGDSAFYNCPKLSEDISLENTTSMGRAVFYGCSSLKGDLNLEKLTSIKDAVFRDCQNITSVKSLGNITDIPGSLFQNCISLKSVETDKNIKQVRNNSFYGCSSLKSIEIDQSELFETGAFTYCSNLERVQFPKNAEYGKNSFYGCALDLSKGYPEGTYPSGEHPGEGKPLDAFAHQAPRAYFTLQPTTTSIGLNGTYADPSSIKTLHGTDFKDIITPRAEWITGSVKMPKVNLSLDPKECAKKHGTYNIEYSIEPTWYSNSKQSGIFELNVDGESPSIIAKDSTRVSHKKGLVTFESDDSGKYHYIVVQNGADAPTQKDMKKAKELDLKKGNNILELDDLSDSLEKTVYIMAKDANDNYSSIVKKDIQAWAWTLNVDVKPSSGGIVNINGGSASNSETAKFSSGSALKLKTKPRSGYVFAGWTSEDKNMLSSPSGIETLFTMLDKNTNIEAKFEELVVKGGLVYKDIDGNGRYDKSADGLYKSKDNLTVDLYIQENSSWKKVDTCKVDDDGSYKFKRVKEGTYRVKVNTGEKYVTEISQSFVVKDGAHMNIGQDLPVQAELNLKAKFINQNGDDVGKLSQIYGLATEKFKNFSKDIEVSAVAKELGKNKFEIPIPEYKHYNLADKNPKIAKLNFDDPGTFDQTIEFKLQGNTYNITYDLNGASKNSNPTKDSVIYPDNKIKNLPRPPSKRGCTFNGWSKDKAGKSLQFDLSTSVTEDITVYAQWNDLFYNLRYNMNGSSGKAPNPESLKYEEKASKVTDPERKGYDFGGWNSSKDGKGDMWNYSTTTMPDSDVTLYAQWHKNEDDGQDGNQINTNINNGGSGGTESGSGKRDFQSNNSGSENTSSNTDPTVQNQAGTETEVGDGLIGNNDDSTVNIAGNEIPLIGSTGTWALINLILAIAGATLAICASIITTFRRRDEQDNDETRNTGLKWLILGVIAAVTSVALFLATQDIMKDMAIMDKWTAFNVLLFIVQIIATVFMVRNNNRKKINEITFD